MGRLHEIASELREQADDRALNLSAGYGPDVEMRDPRADSIAEFAEAVADLLEPV